ncbi:TonB family protein [Roseateles sp. SL47]|uniref:energy transducer TonB n=1 Tax=Roseateles sp. SL47 TaxID=2995138 RepID=UPI002270D82A|nr:TonB family protein [Roseateles sp. SL47]WAC75034.1 TonB family protein [Roseateles sp. SL47]
MSAWVMNAGGRAPASHGFSPALEGAHKAGGRLRWHGGIATVAVHGLLLLALLGTRSHAPLPKVATVPPSSMQWVAVRPLFEPSSWATPAAPTTRTTPAVVASLAAPPAIPVLPIPTIGMDVSPERHPSESQPVATALGSDVRPQVPLQPSGASPRVADVSGTTGSTTEAAPSAPTSVPAHSGVMATAVPPTQLLAAARSDPATAQDQPATVPANYQQCRDSQTARHYPALLRERGVQGLVRLRVKVDENGRAAEVLIANGSGFRLLDEAARRVAESCPYVPARRGDQRMVSWIDYAVRFALQPAAPGSL